MADDSFSLDFGEKYIKIVDSKLSNNKIELVSLGFTETIPNFFYLENEPLREKQAEIIFNLYNTLKIKKKSLNIIIPDSFTYSQIIEMPKLNEKELLSAINYQADQFIPMPISETTLDIEILKEDKVNKKLAVLIVASPKKIVENIEKTIELTGLVPESLENELSCVGRLFSELIKPKVNKVYLIFNFGYSTSSIYLVNGENGLILMARTFKLGLELFMKDIKVNLNLDESKTFEILKTIGFEKNASYDINKIILPLTKELIDELNKFIILAKDQYNLDIEKIYVFNHSSFCLSLDKAINDLLSIPTESLNLNEFLVKNPITESFAKEIPLFISAIAANIR